MKKKKSHKTSKKTIIVLNIQLEEAKRMKKW
jgi:hypothetical protein